VKLPPPVARGTTHAQRRCSLSPGFVATVPQCVLFGPVCVSVSAVCVCFRIGATAVLWPPQFGDCCFHFQGTYMCFISIWLHARYLHLDKNPPKYKTSWMKFTVIFKSKLNFYRFYCWLRVSAFGITIVMHLKTLPSCCLYITTGWRRLICVQVYVSCLCCLCPVGFILIWFLNLRISRPSQVIFNFDGSLFPAPVYIRSVYCFVKPLYVQLF